MARKQAYALAGALLFMSGLFKPFHAWAGRYDLVIALISVAAVWLAAWRKTYRLLICASIGTMGSLAYTIATFKANMRNLQRETPGLQTIEITALDWLPPLAGIVLLLVAGLAKPTPPQADSATNENAMPSALAWMLSLISPFLPLLAIGGYPILDGTGFGPALYGLSVALAASFWEPKGFRRLLFAIPVAVLGLPLLATLDAIMIMCVVFASGAISVGFMPYAIRHRWWANMLYRLCRGLISGSLIFLVNRMDLPRRGNCPFGGGDITDVFMTFVAFTYLPIAGMLAMDGAAKCLKRSRKLPMRQTCL